MQRKIRWVVNFLRYLPRSFFARIHKYPWLPGWVYVSHENIVHPHVPEEHPEWFDAYNRGTTELEILNWLHATVLALKPQAVLETGAANGVGTIALASACKLNGFGKVHSVELDEKLCKQLKRKVALAGLSDFVEVHCSDSRNYLRETGTTFDIGFFDSMCEFRADEFEICLSRGIIKKLAVFHDTAERRCETLKGYPSEEEHIQYRADLKRLSADPRVSGSFESALSRGIWCIFMNNVTN